MSCEVCSGELEMTPDGDRRCEECKTIHRNGYLQFEDVAVLINTEGDVTIYMGDATIIAGRVRGWDVAHTERVDKIVIAGAVVEFTGAVLDVFGKVRIKDNVIELSHKRNHTLRW